MEKLNGVEVYFNMADADFYEKYMANAEEMDKAMSRRLNAEDAADYKNTVSVFRERCNGVKTFLDKVFGKGMGDNICGIETDVVVCSEVYKSIIEIADRQTETMVEKIKDVFSMTNVDVNAT